MTGESESIPERDAHLGAVLFDLDGVLIDSFEAWFRLVGAARHAFRLDRISREAFGHGWGQGVEADLDTFFPGRTFEEVAAFFTLHFLDHIDHVDVDPAGATTLELLRARGHPLAIVTNTRHDLAEIMLRTLGLRDRVDTLVASGDVPRDKPAPDMLLEACRRLDRPTSRSVMVGDSRFDREAARAAAVPFIGFQAEGDRRVESLRELPALLGRTDWP